MQRGISRVIGGSGAALMLAIALAACGPKNPPPQPEVSGAPIQGAALDSAPVGEALDAPAKAEVAAAPEAAPEIPADPAPEGAAPAAGLPTGVTNSVPSASGTTTEIAVSAPIAKPSADAAASAPAADPSVPPAPGGPAMAKAPDLEDGKMDGEHRQVSFALLASYNYVYPNLEENKTGEGGAPALPDQIPQRIKDLNGKKVVMQGFMLPSEVEKGKIKSFVLLQNTMGCCFGVMPMMNEWVYVDMVPGSASEFYPDVPITVYGTLEVGEEIEQGAVISLYRMKSDKVTPPKLSADLNDLK